MKKIIFITVLLAIIITAGYKVSVNQQKKKEQMTKSQSAGKKDRSVPVTITEISTGIIEQKLVVSGEIEALNKADISPKLAGNIKQIYGSIGSYVEKNKRLIWIDDEEYREQLKNAEITYSVAAAQVEKQKIDTENSKIQFNRAKELFENKLVSREFFENAETKFKTAAAALNYNNTQLDQERNKIEQAKIKLSYTQITAPFSGFIENIICEAGSYISAGKTVMTFVDLSKVKIVINVMESYYPAVKHGAHVNIKINILNREFIGKITNISPGIDSSSKTFRVEIAVENTDGILRSGMSASVSIVLNKINDGLIAPAVSLFKLNDKTGVFLIKEDNTVEFMDVEVINMENDIASFTSKKQIPDKSKIVLLGGHLLKSGDKISAEAGTDVQKRRKKNG